MSDKIHVVATLSSPYAKDRGFVLAITTSTKEIGGISTAQAILNFLSLYKDTFEIEVDNISITDKVEEIKTNVYGENSYKFTYSSISFNPIHEKSNFYGPISDLPGSIEDEITLSSDNVIEEFNYFLLGLFHTFISSANTFYENEIEGADLYYPCYEAWISKTPGWLIESIPSEARSNMLYFMKKLLDEGKIHCYGIRHKGDISKPRLLEKYVLKNRYGWFITHNTMKNLLNNKDQIHLSKKNFTLEKGTHKNEKNIFDIFHALEKNSPQEEDEDD